MIYFLPLFDTHTHVKRAIYATIHRIFREIVPSLSRRFCSRVSVFPFPVLSTTNSKSKLKISNKIFPAKCIVLKRPKTMIGIFYFCLHMQTVLFRQTVSQSQRCGKRKNLLVENWEQSGKNLGKTWIEIYDLKLSQEKNDFSDLWVN